MCIHQCTNLNWAILFVQLSGRPVSCKPLFQVVCKIQDEQGLFSCNTNKVCSLATPFFTPEHSSLTSVLCQLLHTWHSLSMTHALTPTEHRNPVNEQHEKLIMLIIVTGSGWYWSHVNIADILSHVLCVPSPWRRGSGSSWCWNLKMPSCPHFLTLVSDGFFS